MEVYPSAIMDWEFPSENEVDPIDEIRLRTWARKNYSPAHERDDAWHPVIHDEMNRMDREATETSLSGTRA